VSSGRREHAVLLAVIVASLGLTLALVELAAAPREGPRPREPAPLRFAEAAQRCESCHPRQTAEWQRSVMAHASRSPLFEALELLIEEQVGRSASCPEGAGVLRGREPGRECRDPTSGVVLTGAGGEGWCVNCHAPGQNLTGRLPRWSGIAPGPDNRPLGELLSPAGRDGIGCTFCHQVSGPVRAGALAGGEYEGNPSWISFATGATFLARSSAHDRRQGISNSGYRLSPSVLLASAGGEEPLVPGGAHRRVAPEQRDYLASSAFCGSCHDVRLFGTDVLGGGRGEHAKRLRNAYSEWLDYARGREARGLSAPSCQSCHLSSYPGVCVPGAGGTEPSASLAGRACPTGTHFEPRDPGDLPSGYAAAAHGAERAIHPHYFSGVELPLTPEVDPALADERALDAAGLPLGVRARRDLLLAASVRLSLGAIERRGTRFEIPLTVENVGAGHRVPAGFSQERELWLELSVRDPGGRVLYEVGRLERADDDLRDKRMLRVATEAVSFDAAGRPLGLFGADVADGPDVPLWDPPPELGGTSFRGRGLVNFQNGFLRCVRCIGRIDASGRCQPLPGQEAARADRYADGEYDQDTGACGSNLTGRAALFETYFPVGSLDASRGLLKAPDAIIDTRSLPPATPVTYRYELDLAASRVRVTARLLFRAFPPYLIRAFAAYEASMAARGARSRPLVTEAALDRLDVVELARVEGNGG
jgi:eukaryotic-like serine/threonine-protein kinase